MAGAPVIKYGLFLNRAIVFIILSFVIFSIVRLANRFHLQQTPAAPAAPTTNNFLFCLLILPLRPPAAATALRDQDCIGSED